MTDISDFFVEPESDETKVFEEIKNTKTELSTNLSTVLVATSSSEPAKVDDISDFLSDECEENQKVEEIKKVVEQKMTVGDQIQNQIDISMEILKEIRTVYPYSIISGGAPRDWYMGNLSKDTDIYILQTQNNQVSIEKLEEIINLKIADKKESNDSLKVNNNYDIFINELKDFRKETVAVRTVLKTTYKDHNFDLIVMHTNIPDNKLDIHKTHDYMCSTFDFGLCMISYDGQFIISDKFMSDYQNKFLTIYLENMVSPHILFHVMKKHLPKMCRKFPEYQVKLEMNDKFKAIFERSYMSYYKLIK